MRWVFAWLLLIACCTSCGPASGLPADQRESFEQLASRAKEAKDFRLFEGLPHQTLDGELFESESKRAKTIEFDGFLFYETPLTISNRDRKEILDGVTDSRQYTTYTEGKACGGFHPDFLIQYGEGSSMVSFLLCFGCGEVRTLSGTKDLHFDMTRYGKADLKALFTKFRNQRPEGYANYWKR